MSKVLLVDTNFSSAPIYRGLLSMGHEVHVVGGNPQDYLAKSSTNYWPINYADIQSLQTLVDREKFEFVVPGCTDRSYESCTLLNARVCLGIDPHEKSQTLNNKGRFKRWAQNAGFPVAKLQVPAQTGLRWPLIVKPVDAFSGKGVTILKSPDEEGLDSAIALAKEASPSKDFLIEDFVEGQLYSHSAFLQDHHVQHDFVVREDGTVNPFVVDTSCVEWSFPFTVLSRIRDCIETISSQLGLVDGLIHTQFILKDDQFWLIELTRRCPGDLYSQLIELSSGFSYARNYALSFLGGKILKPFLTQIRQNIMRHTITVDTACTFDHLNFEEPVWMQRWVALSLAGDSLKPSPASRVGIMFCKTRNDKELERLYGLALTRKLYNVIT
jgi:formate-dependent phosphoribosylglycinamide formyltransferase (GAR transformylase)